MLTGHIDKFSETFVGGWAADPDQPDLAVPLTIHVDGRRVAAITADRLRPDLAARGTLGTGHHGFRFTFPAPLRPEAAHTIRVCHEDGTLLPPGEVVLAATAAPAATDSTGLIPILITGSGRSGTTLLMGLLAGAPEIIAANLVPYETRLLSYYANARHVLTQPADMERSTHTDRLHGDGFHIGFNPFNSAAHRAAFAAPFVAQDYQDHYVSARLDRAFADLIGEYYHRLALDQGKPQARFFAEKNNNVQELVRTFTRRAFTGTREIITVRDPRDILCSYLAYFKADAERCFNDIGRALRVILALHAQQPRDVYFNPYERLLRGDPAALRALADFLQTELRPANAGQVHDVFTRHGTSPTPDATIGRWRTDLSAGWRARCAEAWGEFLGVFGYGL